MAQNVNKNADATARYHQSILDRAAAADQNDRQLIAGTEHLTSRGVYAGAGADASTRARALIEQASAKRREAIALASEKFGQNTTMTKVTDLDSADETNKTNAASDAFASATPLV